VGATIGLWIALTLGVPAPAPPPPQPARLATMRPINLNLPNVPPTAAPAPRPAWSNFQVPLPKPPQPPQPPPAPAWARALLGAPNRFPSGTSARTGGHGGGRAFRGGPGFVGGGRGAACHGGHR